MKPRAMPCWASQDGWIMVKSSDKMWSTGEGNGKPRQYPCLENLMNRMKRQRDMTLKIDLPKSACAQYATGEEWRNNFRKNEELELQSMGSQRVKHDWATNTFTFHFQKENKKAKVEVQRLRSQKNVHLKLIHSIICHCISIKFLTWKW